MRHTAAHFYKIFQNFLGHVKKLLYLCSMIKKVFYLLVIGFVMCAIIYVGSFFNKTTEEKTKTDIELINNIIRTNKNIKSIKVRFTNSDSIYFVQRKNVKQIFD